MKRIIQLDGLRTLAVFGVIWAHTWAFIFQTPALNIGINWAKVISFFGTGVDLFFVISGFCMYQMYAGKQTTFELQSFIQFIKKRWLRIAPAYYVCVFITGLIFFLQFGVIPYKETLVNILFINNTGIPLDNPHLIFHFWSLSVEWHFYLLLPLLIHSFFHYGFKKTIIIVLLINLLLKFILNYSFSEFAPYWSSQIFNKFMAFGFGIIVAKLYTHNYKIPVLLSGNIGFLVALLIAYLGRIAMTNEVLNFSGNLLPLLNTINEPILALGYALMVWNVISSTSIFARFFSNSIVVYLGKISYSIYLWHWIVCSSLGVFIVKYLGYGFWANQAGFVAIMIVTIFIAHFSYQWFESFYFKKK